MTSEAFKVSNNQEKSPWLAYGLAATAILIWGATPAATLFAVREMDPLAAALWRTVLAGMIATPFLMFGPWPRPKGFGQWGGVGLTALAGFTGFSVLFSLGVSQTSASHAALINATNPLFASFFAMVFDRRLPSLRWFVGISIAFGGVSAMVLLRAPGTSEATLVGDLLCLASAVAAGFGYVTGSHTAKRLGALNVTFWAVTLAAVVQAPLLLMWPYTDWLMVGWKGQSSIVFMAVGSSILAYGAWNWCLANLGVVRVAPLQFLMPVISLSLAVAFFGDILTLPIFAAVAAVMMGILLSRKGL